MKKVISLTTIPPRFPLIRKTLESLDRQNVDAVHLNLPRYCLKTQSYYELPEWFQTASWERIQLNHCDTDYGPATKVIPALELEPDPSTQILVCDDDYWYEDDWSDIYFEQFSSGQFVCGNGANTRCIEQDLVQDFALSESQSNHLRDLFSGRHFDFPEAFSGLLLERSALEVERFKHLAQLNRACFYADDLVVAKLLHDNNQRMNWLGLERLNMHSLDHYGMVQWSLAGGTTGGNRRNYMQAFPALVGLEDEVNRLVSNPDR